MIPDERAKYTHEQLRADIFAAARLISQSTERELAAYDRIAGWCLSPVRPGAPGKRRKEPAPPSEELIGRRYFIFEWLTQPSVRAGTTLKALAVQLGCTEDTLKWTAKACRAYFGVDGRRRKRSDAGTRKGGSQGQGGGS